MEKQYVIQKRGEEWCLLTSDGSKTLGCHPTEKGAQAQERAVQANKHAMAAMAAWAAEDNDSAGNQLSQALSIIGVKSFVAVPELVTYFAGFSEGMCDKFGMDKEGGTTNCMDSMEGKVDDTGAFCASLHQWCTGKWPAEKSQSNSSSRSYEEHGMEDGMECKMDDGSMGVVKGGKCMSKPPETYTLNNVEIFAAGKHNGDDYTEVDLDEMVSASKEMKFNPPLKAGHDETPGRPALGWVTNLRRMGAKLVADITHIPKEIYDTIRRRGYDRVSSEVYWNLNSGGKKFRRALKAVALLGADVPAVTSLAPLHTMFSGMTGEIHNYDFPFPAEGGLSMSDKKSLEDMQVALADLQKRVEAGGGSGGNGQETEEQKALRQLVYNMQEQVRILQKKTEEAGDVHKKYVELQDALAASQRQISELQETRRQETVSKTIEEVKIPVFRPFIQAMLDVATKEERVVKFSRPGQTSQDMTLEKIVKDFIVELNKQSTGLFKDWTTGKIIKGINGEIDLADKAQVSNLVDEKAKAYMLQTKTQDYRSALKAVLDAEPDLKAAYSS